MKTDLKPKLGGLEKKQVSKSLIDEVRSYEVLKNTTTSNGEPFPAHTLRLSTQSDGGKCRM